MVSINQIIRGAIEAHNIRSDGDTAYILLEVVRSVMLNYVYYAIDASESRADFTNAISPDAGMPQRGVQRRG